MNDRSVYMLAFSPHPVDTEWGIAGTVASLIKQGKEVVYVIATNGNTGSSNPAMKPQVLQEIREGEQLAAAKILGVKEVIFLRHQDLGLEYTMEFRKEIIRLLMEYRPQVVATCDPYQRYLSNRDHRILGQIVMDSVWPAALSPNTFPDLLEKGYKMHKVKEVWLWATQEPNFTFDITDTFDIKMKAFACHKTQQGEPFEEFLKMFSERAVASAKGTDYKMAEAFHRMEALQRL
jgi:LmbE family N-acetylglucosaminyl deacetylase